MWLSCDTHTYLVAAMTSQKPTCILEMDKKRIIKLLPECKIQAIVQYHERNLTRVDALGIRQLKIDWFKNNDS